MDDGFTAGESALADPALGRRPVHALRAGGPPRDTHDLVTTRLQAAPQRPPDQSRASSDSDLHRRTSQGSLTLFNPPYPDFVKNVTTARRHLQAPLHRRRELAPRLHLGVDLVARFDLGDPQFIRRLEVQPELRRRAEVAGQAKGRVGGNAPLPVQDRGDAIRGNGKMTGEGVGRQAKLL